MPINFFTTIDAVLSQGISDICEARCVTEEEAIEEARRFLEENSEAYNTDVPEAIQYNNALCRIAYLYTYVGAHANLIDNAFYKFPLLGRFVRDQVENEGTIHVCSLGGGPGSELLGFIKYIERYRETEECVDINFALIDRVATWDETWQALVDGLEQTFRREYGNSRRNWPVIIQRSFLSIDLTDLNAFQDFLQRFNPVQIFILNYTLSELINHQAAFSEVFVEIASRAQENAFFLFIDRNQAEVKGFARDLADAASLDNFQIIEENTHMDPDEEKTDLGRWYDLMERDPKLTWRAFYALAQKPEDIPF